MDKYQTKILSENIEYLSKAIKYPGIKYIKLFGKEIGRYGYVRFDIPSFCCSYQYEFIKKIFRIFGLMIVTDVIMLNRGEFNKQWDLENQVRHDYGWDNRK